jgi:hypothetical protein
MRFHSPMAAVASCNPELDGSVLHVRHRQALQQRRQFILRGLPPCNADHRVEEQANRIVDIPSIETEKDKRGKVIRIRRGHSEDVAVQELSGERRHRNNDSRLESSSVTHSLETAKHAKLRVMERLHVLDSQKVRRIGHFASLRNVRSCFRTTRT